MQLYAIRKRFIMKHTGTEYGEPEKGTVVLIHGLGADHAMWGPQIIQFPEEGYRVIVPDMRGHGKSDSVEELKIADWSYDIRDLLDTLKLLPRSLLITFSTSFGAVTN